MKNKRCNTISKIGARFIRDESGASAVEYGILLAAIAGVIITIVVSVGSSVSGLFTLVDGKMK